MTKENQENNLLIQKSSHVVVVFAFIILAIKAYTWQHTKSESILASLIDSLLDISSSIINVIAIGISLIPPDNNHRFGHEKFQDLAIFSQSIFFFISCVFTILHSIKSIFTHNILNNLELGIKYTLITTFLTLLLVIYQTYVIHKTKAKIVETDKLHYLTDLLTNIAVIVSLYISNIIWWIDAVFGILIAIYILNSCYGLFRYSVKNLADEEMDNNSKEKILSIAFKNKEIKGVHDLKTRCATNKCFIQLHIELDGQMSLNNAHKISDALLDELKESFPNTDIIIHQDPENITEDVSYPEENKQI